MKKTTCFILHNGLFLTTFLFSVLTGCKKSIEVSPPIDQLVTAEVFIDSVSAEAAVLGLYSQLTYYFSEYKIFNGLITLTTSLSADEIEVTSSNVNEDEFLSNTVSISNNYNYTLWRSAYSQLYHSNILLENLKATSALSDHFKSQLIAEVCFIRALHYFYLVNLYGPVPLALTSDYRVNGSLKRSGIDDVYLQIKEDLEYAKLNLPKSFPGMARVRANKWAASALLARVFLYQKKWDNAIQEASDVISSNDYKLVSPEQLFVADNEEAILQFYPSITSPINVTEGSLFIPATETTRPNYKLSTALLNSFEPGDVRRSTWVDSSIVENVKYHYPFKYKIRLGATNQSKLEYSQILRLSEQYLIRSEAYTQLGEITNALDDIDKIRKRSGLSLLSITVPGITQQQLHDTIIHERRIEFFTECGHRWLDLKRTGNAESSLKPLKPLITKNSLLFPIPEQDLLLNPFLHQNEGYN